MYFQKETNHAKYHIQEKMNKTIIARNNELECLKKNFDHVLEGGSLISFITGLPGIGKTFLVENVVKELISSNVTYVYGKFRQHDKKPFIAIIEIIEQMVKHILTMPYDLLENIKNVLKKALGTDLQIITSLSPYARKLFSHHKTINMDEYKKHKYRVKKALYQFITIISETLFPVIMFIDDLQWMDTPSLEVIELICKDNELLNLMLILAYRNNEEKGSEKVEYLTKIPQIKKLYTPIQLHELRDKDVKEYLQLILGENTENVDYLARIIYGLTLGNPFYIKEIIDVFIQEDILLYSPNRNQWIVKIDSMNKLSLPSDIEQIIINKINKLNHEEQLLLEWIACLDGKVEYKILKRIIGSEDALLNSRLQALCKAAFLVQTAENYQTDETLSYGFVHDIILELVYRKIDSVKKKEYHYNIVKSLIDHANKTFIENNRLFIASQLLRSDHHILTQENTERWIYEFYYAGIETKQTMAVEQALKLFECCEELFAYCNFKEKYDMEMKNNLEIGECLFICERYDEAKKRFEILITKYNTVENLITIKRKYMSLYAYNGNPQKVVELGIQVLNHLDFNFNIKHVGTDLLKEKLLLSNKKIKQLGSADYIKDKRILMILETLIQMAPSANLTDERIFKSILVKVGILSIKYGNSPYAPIGYAAYSFILYNIWKDNKKGRKLADITFQSLEAEDNISTKSISHFLMGTFIDHLLNPMTNTIVYLEKSVEEGTRIGEFLYSGYSITSIIKTKYVMGIPLKELANYINLQEQKLLFIGQDTVRFICDIYKNHIHYLEQGVYLDKGDVVKKEIQSLNVKGLTYYAFMLQRLYLEGYINTAYILAEDIKQSIGLLKGHITYIDLIFYILLTRISNHKTLQAVEKKKNKRLIKKYMKDLEYRINIYKENHYARYLLVKAEYVALFQKERSIERMYTEAISFAENTGQLQLEAIGNLLAAMHYEYNRKLSKFYAKEAVNLFEKWGAMHIANLIQNRYGLLNNNNQLTEIQLHMKIEGKVEVNEEINKNIIYHLNQIENMEEQQGFMYILDYLTSSNQANYGAVLFEKSDDMYLQYEKKSSGKVIGHTEPINMKQVRYMSRKIIRYVARTGEEVILNQKPEQGIYTKDLYIMDKDQISIVCIPIKYLGVFVGIIYLEKLCQDGFGEDITPIIKSIIPSLISKRTTIKDVNLQSLLNPVKVPSPLTNRELEVLQLVAEGMSNATISKQLYISLGTVKNHLSNIYSKLEVDSRIKSVVKAKKLNIIKI